MRHGCTISLLQGQETEQRMELVLSLTSIKSESIKAALIAHYVNGYPAPMAQMLHDVSQQEFSRASVKVNKIYKTVRMICDV